jgi:hypothetical protein
MLGLYRRSLFMKVLLPLMGALVGVAIPIIHGWATQPSAAITERRIGLFVFVAVIGYVAGSAICVLYHAIVLRRYLRQSGVACLRCGYSLETLPRAGTCPECGATYDRATTVQAWKDLIGERGWARLHPDDHQ